MVDVSKIKPGDEVTVRAKVNHIHATSRVPVSIVMQTSPEAVHVFCIEPSVIATHTPAPRSFAPGDQVTWGGGGKGEIIAIDDDFAWVKSGDTRPSIHISYLRHADAPADEIVVTDEEAKRAFDFFYDGESGVCEGAMQKTLVDFLKRRKEAGR